MDPKSCSTANLDGRNLPAGDDGTAKTQNPLWSRRAFLKSHPTLGGAAIGLASKPNASAAPPGRPAPTNPGRLKKVRDFDVRKDPDYYYRPSPSAVIFPDGEIVLAFRRHPAAARTHTHVETANCVMNSRDGGKTWTTPQVIDYGGVHNVNLSLE